MGVDRLIEEVFMGAQDLNNGSVDLDSARLERSTRTNQPEYAPGQSDTSGLFDNSLGVSNAPQNNAVDFNGMFNNTQGVYGTTPVQQTQQQPAKKDGFEVAWEIIKSIGCWIKDVGNSVMKDTNPKFWAMWGSLVARTTVFTSVAGVVLWVVGIKSFGFNFLVGSLLAMMVGVCTLMFLRDKAKEYDDIQNGVLSSSDSSSSDFPCDTALDMGDGFNFDSDEDSEFDYDDDDNEDFDLFGDKHEEPKEGMDTETALDTLADVPAGMYTRQYLYEALCKVLDTITPDYDNVKSYDEDSDTFLTWEQYLRDSAEVIGVKEDDLPELYSLEETALTIRLTCSRPKNFKHEAVAVELANIYANVDGSTNPEVYAISRAIGKECHFTVFTGEHVMVSLKDMYLKCNKFVLDSKNYIPIVVGINQEGKCIYADFKKIESILVTGMPRSGKSWVVQLILTQMCAYLSPRELHLYILDPKDDISDFRSFTLPHVKKFVSGDENIVNTLRKIIKEEAPRRKKLIGSAGKVNIWDFKAERPDVDLPIIYVVIDEVVTLAERMDKETKAEFQGYLVELISQLPALGIRAFMIPHVVKNDIIAKTATDLIPCRISVRGDASHIESCVGTKPKDFSFKLSAVGDMAVKITEISPSTLYVHAGVLSASNPKNNKIFDYLRRLWIKLEPNCVEDKVQIVAKNDNELRDLCKNFDVDEKDMLGIDDIELF